MHLFRYIPSRAAKVTTGRDLRAQRYGSRVCGHRIVWLLGRNTESAGSLEPI